MSVCTRKGCVALASDGELCAPHAQGYDQHDGSRELRCRQCRRRIVKGDWYQRTPAGPRHVKPCKVHPDTAKGLTQRESRHLSPRQ